MRIKTARLGITAEVPAQKASLMVQDDIVKEKICLRSMVDQEYHFSRGDRLRTWQLMLMNFEMSVSP